MLVDALRPSAQSAELTAPTQSVGTRPQIIEKIQSVQIRQIRVIRVLFAVQFLPKLAHRVTIKEQFA